MISGRLPAVLARLILIVSAVSAFFMVSPAVADQVSILSVQTGHSLILDAPGLTRVAVGDGRIAGVVPVGTSQIVVNGKAPGRTSINVWTEGGRTTYEVTVSEQNLDDIARLLRTSISLPDVQVISFNHTVLLRGTVEDGQQFQQVQEIVSRFGELAKGAGYSVVNAVTVNRPLGALQQEIASIPGASDIRLDPDGKGNVIISGTVRDQVDAERVLNKAKGLSGAYLSADGRVIDRLTTESNSQISIKTYILEIDKNAASQLGIRLLGGSPNPVCCDQNGTITFGDPLFQFLEVPSTSNVPGGALKIGAFARVTQLAPALDLLLSSGHARELASPNLVTTPGKNATFLVGGSIPYALNAGNGAITIVFKDYGVQLDVTPTILGNGGVETEVKPEVSDLDYANGIQQNGFTVPALKISRLSTTVITHSGESIVLGGLLKRIETRQLLKIPGLSQLPILGKLFTSTSYLRQETDVVFVMTPEVIAR